MHIVDKDGKKHYRMQADSGHMGYEGQPIGERSIPKALTEGLAAAWKAFEDANVGMGLEVLHLQLVIRVPGAVPELQTIWLSDVGFAGPQPPAGGLRS